jgi:hypothetical protein
MEATKKRTTILNILIIIILLIGLVVGLILIRNPQVFKPRAANSQIQFFGDNLTPTTSGRLGFTKIDGEAKIGIQLISPFGAAGGPQSDSSPTIINTAGGASPIPTFTTHTPPPIVPSSPPQVSGSSNNCSESQTTFVVKPYLVYPADKPTYPEYESGLQNYLTELQQWYCDKVGLTFNMAPLEVVISQFNYLNIRCGPNPSTACINDPSILNSNLPQYMNLSINNSAEFWEEQTIALVFAAGGGGFAGGRVDSANSGFAVVGDWAIEPITGKANDWGIPCTFSDGWQCAANVAQGTPAHELGHAFGLFHPDPATYPGDSIMKWHGGYPTVGFLPHEIEYLRQSPYF